MLGAWACVRNCRGREVAPSLDYGNGGSQFIYYLKINKSDLHLFAHKLSIRAKDADRNISRVPKLGIRMVANQDPFILPIKSRQRVSRPGQLQFAGGIFNFNPEFFTGKVNLSNIPPLESFSRSLHRRWKKKFPLPPHC